MEAFNVHLFIFFSHTKKADSHAQKFAWDFYLTIFPRLRLCTYDTPRYSDAVCMIYCLEIFTATHLGR